jgi:hypothetical protein
MEFQEFQEFQGISWKYCGFISDFYWIFPQEDVTVAAAAAG